MTGLLAGIGTRIADRWVQTVVLSGLLWIATLAVALRLGHTHPFDTDRLAAWTDEIATRRAGHSAAALLLAAAAALLAAGAAGLAAGALGGSAQRLWGAAGTRPPLDRLLDRRRRTWDRSRARADAAQEQARAAVARANTGGAPSEPAEAWEQALAAAEATRAAHQHRGPRPQRPTRIGDFFALSATRLHDRYRVDLDLVWPRLWPLLPDALRGDLTGARQAYDDAARLAGWGVLYTALAAVWWPAALIGAGVFATAVVRARAAAEVLAVLVEAAVDLHLADLAQQLGLAIGETRELGRVIERHLATGEAAD